MKLVLFDIDGTLLSTDGAARRAFHSTLLDVYGTAGPIETHSFAGKTDPQIARELLTAAGFDAGAIDAGLARLWAGYLTRLSTELQTEGQRTAVMPGVPMLLRRLELGLGGDAGAVSQRRVGGDAARVHDVSDSPLTDHELAARGHGGAVPRERPEADVHAVFHPVSDAVPDDGHVLVTGKVKTGCIAATR